MTRWTAWSARHRLPAVHGVRWVGRASKQVGDMTREHQEDGGLAGCIALHSRTPMAPVSTLSFAAVWPCPHMPPLQEVMDSMYGRLEPKPLAPAYTAQELAAMRAAEEAGKAAARAALASTGGPAYATLELPAPGELSLDCQRYKWRQSQSHVEVFVPLPEGLTARRCSVQLSTSAISISVNDTRVLSGRLYRPIKAEESTWFVQDGVLEVTMLKRNRRGHYEAGTTNAGGQTPWEVAGWGHAAQLVPRRNAHMVGQRCIPMKRLEFSLSLLIAQLTWNSWALIPPPPVRRHVVAGRGAGCHAVRAAAAGAPAPVLLQRTLRGAGEGEEAGATPGQRAGLAAAAQRGSRVASGADGGGVRSGKGSFTHVAAV